MFNFLKRFTKNKRVARSAPRSDFKTKYFMNMRNIWLVQNLVTGDQHIVVAAMKEQAALRVMGMNNFAIEGKDLVVTDITLPIRALQDDPETLKNVMRHIAKQSEKVS